MEFRKEPGHCELTLANICYG